MQKEKIEIKGAILDRPILWGKLQLFPENGSVWAAGMNHTEDRWIQRQVSILRGAVALAIDRSGKNPVQITQHMLPDPEGPEVQTLAWYGKMAGETEEHGRLMCCYNGFGTLPGGFPAVRENITEWAGADLADKLLQYVQMARREEGDLAEKAMPYKKLPAWSHTELERLKQALLNAYDARFGGA